MNTLFGRIACGLVFFQFVGTSIALPHPAVPEYFHNAPFTRRDVPVAQIQRELGSLLSKGTVIIRPSDAGWADATERWNTATEPRGLELVVRPAQESDVSTIVKYCNRNSIEFLATNRGHGASEAVATLKGITIDMTGLTSIKIQPGGKSALIQGGQYIGDVVRTLWAAGYVTSTGSNNCVGFVGPALGGGHGRYQGLHGLASDNFINLNVVLADGSTIKVNKDSHSDLFWAMQGAGHNFGIVTSAESKIYRRKIDTWHYHNYVWSQDKLEILFERLNSFHKDGKTPPEMGGRPVLSWNFAYAGSAKDAEKILKPFNDIPALSQQQGDVPYPEIAGIQGMAEGGPGCLSNLKAGTSVGLRSYNVTSQRQILTLFNATMASYPSLAAGGVIFYEGYSTKAVQAVDPVLTAYPHRDDLHLAFTTFVIPSPELMAPAQKLANDIRDVWYASQPGRRPTTYSNYATGDESLESIYGYEPWRMQRLLGLKAKYDPHNRFRFYVPLIKG
ncbi:FAD-binding domain-containing protein [Apiospora hydei]|uniref:FAD-binding domain-containing protein n=1 Tax=Apiospora hydei TaxID=1337664 RepID=A0ABR1VI96_9PEZI